MNGLGHIVASASQQSQRGDLFFLTLAATAENEGAAPWALHFAAGGRNTSTPIESGSPRFEQDTTSGRRFERACNVCPSCPVGSCPMYA